MSNNKKQDTIQDEKVSSPAKKADSKFNTIISVIFKVATIVLFVLIVALICIDFFDTSKSYISYELIVSLCLAVVIVCLDSFDHFQLGNILRLEKEKKVIETDNKALREQNNVLIGMISNNQNNVKIENEIHVFPTDNILPQQKDNVDGIDTYKQDKESTAFREREELLSYIRERLNKNMYETTIIWAPALGSNVISTQPDCSLFDLYIKQNGVEEFIEIKYLVPNFNNFKYIDMQLSAIRKYNYINHRNAKYVLMICNKKLEDSERLSDINHARFRQLASEYAEEIETGFMKIIMR